jgi:hypothetical protein
MPSCANCGHNDHDCVACSHCGQCTICRRYMAGRKTLTKAEKELGLLGDGESHPTSAALAVFPGDGKAPKRCA